jgi:hypothetical protein
MRKIVVMPGVTNELIFTCCEFAAACWRGQQAERLCQVLQLLASKAGPRTNPLILVESYTRHHLGSEGTPTPTQVAELFQTLHRASPFRIFDRPGSAPLQKTSPRHNTAAPRHFSRSRLKLTLGTLGPSQPQLSPHPAQPPEIFLAPAKRQSPDANPLRLRGAD